MSLGDVGNNNSTQKPPPNFARRILRFLLVFAVAAGVRYAVATAFISAEIKAKVLSGSGWDGARTELTNKISLKLKKNLGKFLLPADAFNALLECEVSEQIRWLNTTGCAYEYNTNTTSVAEHIRTQNACVSMAGSATKSEAIDFACTKKNIPNHWAIFTPIFAKSFTAEILKHRTEQSIAHEVGQCVAEKYASAWEETECKPMNMAATSSESLFPEEDVCVDKNQKRLEAKVGKFTKDCARSVRAH